MEYRTGDRVVHVSSERRSRDGGRYAGPLLGVDAQIDIATTPELLP